MLSSTNSILRLIPRKRFLGLSIVAVSIIIASKQNPEESEQMKAIDLRQAQKSTVNLCGRRALVVGGTDGIGAASAVQLASLGASVTVMGRNMKKGAAVVERMRAAGLTSNGSTEGDRAAAEFDFQAADASLLANVKTAAHEYREKHNDGLDFLVLTPTTQSTSREETSEGLDRKLMLNCFCRIAFIQQLLPLLKKSSSPGGAQVLAVLSAGVHSPYDGYTTDFELKSSFTVKNAANAAGFYTDLTFDQLARTHPAINFVHAAPGFVNSNWGSEFKWWLRCIVRPLMKLGKSSEDCATFMLQPVFERYKGNTESGSNFALVKQDGTPAEKTSGHTDEAVQAVWTSTEAMLKEHGITEAL